MKIVVLDGYVGNPGDLSWEPLERLGDVTVYPRSKPEEIVERAMPADVALTNKVVFDRKLIEALPNLKYIGVIATGYNIVDLEAANERGILVANVPAYSTASVAQVAFAHLLNMTTHVEHYTREAREGVWSRSKDYTYCSAPFIELEGKTMGVVAMGNIGSAVARMAAGFGMKVLAFTSKPQEQLPPYVTKATSLDQVFSERRGESALPSHRRDPWHGRRSPLGTDEAHRHAHQHQPWTANRGRRLGYCLEEWCYCQCRGRRAVPGTSRCRQSTSRTRQLLFHTSHWLDKPRSSPAPNGRGG